MNEWKWWVLVLKHIFQRLNRRRSSSPFLVLSESCSCFNSLLCFSVGQGRPCSSSKQRLRQWCMNQRLNTHSSKNQARLHLLQASEISMKVRCQGINQHFLKLALNRLFWEEIASALFISFPFLQFLFGAMREIRQLKHYYIWIQEKIQCGTWHKFVCLLPQSVLAMSTTYRIWGYLHMDFNSFICKQWRSANPL